ncbi:hypothetical protein GX51_03192 [Blastomyces parvus]|uniref:Uncharacterized protein n=1 Tax=Blastomyces parvus TaxID=2060905 RepID=A0A2B7X0G2_9EURO|nr:hypothetical protein GX51_03192 [Blastomyces parvus]
MGFGGNELDIIGLAAGFQRDAAGGMTSSRLGRHSGIGAALVLRRYPRTGPRPSLALGSMGWYNGDENMQMFAPQAPPQPHLYVTPHSWTVMAAIVAEDALVSRDIMLEELKSLTGVWGGY